MAAGNAAAAGVLDRLELRHGPLWEALATGERFDVLVSNPPYVAQAEAATLEPEVRDWEPAGALFAGPSGLELLEALATGAGERLRPGGLLALEVGLGQGGGGRGARPGGGRLRAAGHPARPGWAAAHRHGPEGVAPSVRSGSGTQGEKA